MKRTKCFKRSAWLSSVSLMHVSFLFHMWNFNFQVQGLRLFLQTSFAIETQTRLMKLNQCYLRNFTSQGRVRRDSNPFSNFCPSHPKPKNFQKGGGNQVVVCEANFKVQKRSAGKATCALKKSKVLFFSIEGLKRLRKLYQKVSNRKNFQKLSRTSPIVQPCAGKNNDRVWFVAPQLWIYIYLFYIHCIYVVFILTVAIASLTF